MLKQSMELAMKRLTAFCAITGLLLGEAAAEDRIERIDLTRFTCKQFLELNRDDALVVVGWLQGHYLDEHETPVVDFTCREREPGKSLRRGTDIKIVWIDGGERARFGKRPDRRARTTGLNVSFPPI